MSDAPHRPSSTSDGREGYGCPLCHAGLVALDCHAHGRVGKRLAGSRIAWRIDDPELSALSEEEAATWDAWAGERTGVDVSSSARDWLTGSRTFRPVSHALPQLLNPTGWRMLDIGGTCRDAIKFLHSGVGRVDQVEVSPATQALAIANLEASGIGDWADRVVFHTVPAETLPFVDGTFDFVFSRATIHHTDRTRSLPELARVLRPGGVMMLVEAYLSAPMQALMRARRRLVGTDRGTDKPLDGSDIDRIRALFDDVRAYPYNVLWLAWSQTGHRTAWGRRHTHRIWSWDLAIGNAGGLAWLAGQQCWVIGVGRSRRQRALLSA